MVQAVIRVFVCVCVCVCSSGNGWWQFGVLTHSGVIAVQELTEGMHCSLFHKVAHLHTINNTCHMHKGE